MDDYYPTSRELTKIKKWEISNVSDFHAIMEYIRDRWKYAGVGYWKQIGDAYHIHTGGWSGNEEIVSAMHENALLWVMYWCGSRRGGHYVFAPLRREC